MFSTALLIVLKNELCSIFIYLSIIWRYYDHFSALSKFAAEDSSRSAATAVGGSGSALYTYSSEAEEQRRLEQLRLKLTSLREERSVLCIYMCVCRQSI